uniref:Tail protein n=1 Tax=viral metagenome TaxID=1070528 RepID=A0A6M3MEZ2_9ZZZZ
MLEREAIIEELQARMWTVTGVTKVARNTKAEPSVNDLPYIGIFELPDVVEEVSTRGATKPPDYRRRLSVMIESFIAASSEGASSQELFSFVEELKTKLYAGGPTLGGLCAFKETDLSRVLRPPAGDNTIGIGIALEIVYIEDTTKLF